MWSLLCSPLHDCELHPSETEENLHTHPFLLSNSEVKTVAVSMSIRVIPIDMVMAVGIRMSACSR